MDRKSSPITNVYLGVDPGKSGGIVVLGAMGTGGVFLAAEPLANKSLSMVLDFLRRWRTGGRVPVASLEKVGGYVGGDGQPGSAMFEFGRGYGQLEALLFASGVGYDNPTPQKWQKALGISPRKRGEGKTDWKRRLRAEAERLYPTARITNATADALLLAEYCRRCRTGTL